MHSPRPTLTGRRVLITGAARGIGAALALRLHERGARVALAGIEDELLAAVAAECGDAPWRPCDVGDRAQVDEAVAALADDLGGLDVVVANAGVAAQMPVVGGDPAVLERTLRVNVLGAYYTLRAAGPHISHRDGYALAVASLAAAVHAPLLGAYSASKAAVEALGNTLRAELAPTGARVGVAYFAELDTDMTRRGFDTDAARALASGGLPVLHVAPLKVGIDALERGITRRARRVVAPRWVGPLLPLRMAAQPVLDLAIRRRVTGALAHARSEDAPLTTAQPDSPTGAGDPTTPPTGVPGTTVAPEDDTPGPTGPGTAATPRAGTPGQPATSRADAAGTTVPGAIVTPEAATPVERTP